MSTLKITAVALAAALGPWIAAPAQAAFDITTLPGYGVATSASFNFSDTGWAGWSVPSGKVVLGAKIISSGDSISDFAAFRPAGPGNAFPHYTFPAGEYGWVLQDRADGAGNSGVQMEVYYADPLAGYTITESSLLNYNGAGGYGGWSAPSGDTVSGGGYQFVNSYSSATLSALALENSVWPHYTFGANEQGWVVQGPKNDLPNPGRVYVVSFDTPVPVPVPAALPIIGAALAGFGFAGWRQRKSAA